MTRGNKAAFSSAVDHQLTRTARFERLHEDLRLIPLTVAGASHRVQDRFASGQHWRAICSFILSDLDQQFGFAAIFRDLEDASEALAKHDAVFSPLDTIWCGLRRTQRHGSPTAH